MRILVDHEIVSNLESGNPMIVGIQRPADWYSRESPVQASSVDLTIGRIYLPGVGVSDSGSAANPKNEHVLRTGETAVIATRETLNFGTRTAGFGFPPSHVSVKGLLMTNPGHVDPGYTGPMRFTVINMGRADCALIAGAAIVTLLLFDLEEGAKAGWLQRRGGEPGSYPTQQTIDRLAPDFVNVRNRATEIAEGKIRDSERKWIIWAALITAVLSLAGVLATNWFTYTSGLDDVKRRTAILEQTVTDRVAIDRRIDDISNRVTDLQKRLPPEKSPPR